MQRRCGVVTGGVGLLREVGLDACRAVSAGTDRVLAVDGVAKQEIAPQVGASRPIVV